MIEYQPAIPRLIAHLQRGIPADAEGKSSKWDVRLFVVALHLILFQVWLETVAMRFRVFRYHLRVIGRRLLAGFTDTVRPR